MPSVTQHIENAVTDQSGQCGSVCPDWWHSDLNTVSVSKLDSATKPRLRGWSLPVWSNPQILSEGYKVVLKSKQEHLTSSDFHIFKISCLKVSAVQKLVGSGSLQIELPWHLQSDLPLSVCFKFNKIYSSHIWPQSAPINCCSPLKQKPCFHVFIFTEKHSAHDTMLWNGIIGCQKTKVTEREKNHGMSFLLPMSFILLVR